MPHFHGAVIELPHVGFCIGPLVRIMFHQIFWKVQIASFHLLPHIIEDPSRIQHFSRKEGIKNIKAIKSRKLLLIRRKIKSLVNDLLKGIFPGIFPEQVIDPLPFLLFFGIFLLVMIQHRKQFFEIMAKLATGHFL